MAEFTRKEWIERSTEENIQVTDTVFSVLNKVTKHAYEPGYTASFIGVRINGKATNFITMTPQKTSVLLGVRMKESFPADQIISMLVGENYQYQKGWYTFHIDAATDLNQLTSIFLQSEKEYFANRGQVMSEKIEVVKDELMKEAEVSEPETESAKQKYWIFAAVDLLRAYSCDEDSALESYKESNEDFDGTLEDVIEEMGTDFVSEYMCDSYTDYFTAIHKVGVVAVAADKELSDYYHAQGEGFDYIEYEDGFGCNCEEDIQPGDFSGLVAMERSPHNVAVYELYADDFDIEKLDLYSPDNVEYDGWSLTQINLDGDSMGQEIYLDGRQLY